MMKTKRLLAVGLAGTLVLSAAGCGGGEKTVVDNSVLTEADIKPITEYKLGEDYTDLTATVKVITPRSDLVDNDFADYTERFNELYPNITIKYEAPTDYSEDMTLRLTTDDWGEVCMIPTSVDKDEFSTKFISLGTVDELSKQYIMVDEKAYDGEVYGLASMGNAQGVAYNKKVFKDAGVTSIPKTPDEFLSALQAIKDKTDAIPLYTNFASGWAVGAWDAYIGGTATGDPDFKNVEMVHGKDPFADRGDMTGPYAVYYTLYEAVARDLIEDDPTTSDWEGSKGMINRGEIGTMVLGSWAVSQLQNAGDNGDDIGYMPFPITVNGKQYASAGADYAYAVNIKTSTDNKVAAMLYIKWMLEESGYALTQGGIPTVAGSEYPDVLKDFDDVEFIIDNPAPAGEETLFNDINSDSELGIDSDPFPDQQIVEAALIKSPSLDDIMAEWNEKWTASQEKFGAI